MTMDRFEQELRQALQPQEPAPSFSARVLARIEQAPPTEQRLRNWFSIPWLRWASMALLCVILLAGFGYHYQQQKQRTRGEAMRQQVMTALHIAGAKLQLAQGRVQALSEQ
jgi:hypothetical protein